MWYRVPNLLGALITTCFLSIVPTMCGNWQRSSNSWVIFFHYSSVLLVRFPLLVGFFPLLVGFRRGFIIIKKDFSDYFKSFTYSTAGTLPSIWNKWIKETCHSPDSKTGNVNINRSDVGIAFLMLVSFFLSNGLNKLNKCSSGQTQ